MNKNDVIVQDRRSAVQLAVELMKKGQFGLTAIKVELEAQLGRDRGCDNDCDHGRFICHECNGEWEGEECQECEGSGTEDCDRCDGEGHILLQSGNRSNLNCRDCGGSGTQNCYDCYDGTGYYANCEFCDEGYIECDDCYGESSGQWSNKECHEWFMERLSKEGLAEYDEDRHSYRHHDSASTCWHPKAPLKYAEFYTDGSVDSEFTFTLSMENPENVLLLPKFIEIFNEFASEVSNDFNTTGAGMHMALLNSPNCSYPVSHSQSLSPKFRNFRKSMQLLLPALYFLGSSDEISRGLEYRSPGVGFETHRAAIDWRGGALEFRIFNTCYDKPEAVLDNVVVMSNCLKYWRSEYKKHGLSKITSKINFGIDNSDRLDRFYVTEQHIELLNRGLQLLKPSYYTISELKKQRNFCTTKTHIKFKEKKIRHEAHIEYKEYENRFSWNVVMRRNRVRQDLVDRYLRSTDTQLRLAQSQDEVLTTLEPEVEKEVEMFTKTKLPLERYVQDKIEQFKNQSIGNFTLDEERN